MRFFLLLLLVLSQPVFAEDTELRLGTTGNSFPFSITNVDGTVSGFDVEIGEELCLRIYASCTWVIFDSDQLIPALLTNKIDMVVSPIPVTYELKAKVDLTVPYFSPPLGIIIHENAWLNLASPLLIKQLGVIRGGPADRYATAYWGEEGLQINRYDTTEDLHAALLNNDVEAMLRNALQASSDFLATIDGINHIFAPYIVAGSSKEEREILGVSIAVRKDSDILRYKLNLALEELYEEGTHQRIRDKHFDFNDLVKPPSEIE